MSQLIVLDRLGAAHYDSPFPAISFTAGGFPSFTAGRRDVATDGFGRWVVDGAPGQVSANDGATFTDANADVDSATWTGAVFLAFGTIGADTGIIKSVDGATWSMVQILNNTTLRMVGFAKFADLWVMFQRDATSTPAQSTAVWYASDPEGVWTAGDTVVRDWDEDGAFNPGFPGPNVMPRVVAANDDIVVSFSVLVDDVMWSEDVTAAGPFTAATFVGSGQIWCAVWDGTQWVGGGRFDDAGTMKFSWATSPDGKVWTHNNEPTFGEYCLVDAFFDGTNCWFSSCLTSGAGTASAVWQYDGATWTSYNVNGPSPTMAGIAGTPSVPILTGPGPVEIHADDVFTTYPVDAGVVELLADDALAVYMVDSGPVELMADNLIVLGAGVTMLMADDAEAPDVPSGNFNPSTPCTIGNEWFPRSRGAGVLASDMNTIGMRLVATRADTISQLYPFIAQVLGAACVAVEVYDITAGPPALDALSEFTYYPSSDLYVAAPPWTPGAYGSFNGWNPSAGGAGPWYQALDSTVLTPYTWAISGQPIANDELVFNFFGLGFDFAERFAGVFGTQTGRWVTSVKSHALCAQYLALGATGAFQIQPYLWINGVKYSGPKQSVDVSQGNVNVTAEWLCNPSTGLPWTPADIDKFDSGFIGGDTNGLGWVCQPTGSANNLATILQAQLIVESAPTDPRLVIGAHCVNDHGGWQQWLLRDPADASLSDFTMTPGNTYLLLFRRGSGTGTVSLAYLDDPNNFLPGPPDWSTVAVELDPVSRRPVQISDPLTPAYAMALVRTVGTPSLDSQPYMTLSPLDGVDSFPKLNEYFTNSPVNATYSMSSHFLAASSDEYGWIWILVAQVASQTDGDLTITIRDAATNTAQGVVTITSEDLLTPRESWQRIGVRMDPAPVLTNTTEYYFDISSTASPDQGWLVQVLEEGNEPDPQGGPTGTYRSTWGGGAENLYIGSPLVAYKTKTACITVSTIPEKPTGFDAVNLGEECCLDAIVLVWDEYTDESCGGWMAYEIQRRNPDASTLVNSHAADWFKIAYIDTSPAVVSFEDWEAPNNTEVEYRMRVWRSDGAPSDWTDSVTATTEQSCCGLTFTSNVSPDLTVFYPDVSTGPVVRRFEYPENTQTFEPFDQNGSVVYREIPNRLVTFDAHLRIRSGQAPCGPGCNNPATGAGTEVFDPIRAICLAGLPYVCVKNETGDVWFAFVWTKHGEWQQVAGREIDGGPAVYTFDVTVKELTDTPSFPNEGTGGS